jgi:NCAIR mutase (PurE)-related protein
MEDVCGGRTSVEDAIAALVDLPFEDIGIARLDHHRVLRTGQPEVVLCQGKADEHAARIVTAMAARGHVLATRVTSALYERVRRDLPEAVYHATARVIEVGPRPVRTRPATIAVVSGGTADEPVAEEAAVVVEAFGQRAKRFWDVGVAGLHRLLAVRGQLADADAIIAVAGMEGALPTLVAGLVGGPVIAVPTSVGYGAHLKGLAPLLGMLNSCAPGVSVVNIDNGYGAACCAVAIADRIEESARRLSFEDRLPMAQADDR